MNVRNLATVFGPTVLRLAGSTGSSQTKMSQTLTENDMVIRVLEVMIRNCDSLFLVSFTHGDFWLVLGIKITGYICDLKVSKELQDAFLRHLQETEPDVLDAVLMHMLSRYFL